MARALEAEQLEELNEKWAEKMDKLKNEYEVKLENLSFTLENRHVNELKEKTELMQQEHAKLVQDWAVKYDTLKMFYENELQKVDQSYGYKADGFHKRATEQEHAINTLELSQHSLAHQVELLKLELNRRDQILQKQKQESEKDVEKIKHLESRLRQVEQDGGTQQRANEQKINGLTEQVFALQRDLKQREHNYQTQTQALDNELQQLKRQHKELLVQQNTTSDPAVGEQPASPKEKKEETNNDDLQHERQSLLNVETTNRDKYPTLDDMFCTWYVFVLISSFFFFCNITWFDNQACLYREYSICLGCPIWWCLKESKCHFCR
ncbi:Protein kinase domain containing protein [Reticulomyxa filosa]|uniref:Protein kinase domain containing protein n=1 Tax=Reticulomyxa filosa TaxID=46433 RepID=X6M7I0_RETFI|nr:Protein kinase domain containing protein [Reticulomyxa filosa]|eukprot:ETO08995.1 Protein kinase domain containing protein [Reticulomyxa filosa]